MPYIDPEFALQATTNGAYILTATQTWPASRLISTKVYSKSLSHVYEPSHNPKSNQNLTLNPIPTYHPPYKRGLASRRAYQVCQVLLSLHFFTPHLHRAPLQVLYYLPLLQSRAATQLSSHTRRVRIASGHLRACTQWRSANDACSSTASPAYPPRNGLTRIQSLPPPNSHCPNTGRLLVAHHGSRTHSLHVPFPYYHPSLVQ